MPEKIINLEVKMARVETQIDREVIPSLKRIEESIDKAFLKIKKNNERIDGLENWQKEIKIQAKTAAYLGKKTWLFMGGVIGGIVSIISLIFNIYEKLK